jgi:trehalose/maltose transport system permease protein
VTTRSDAPPKARRGPSQLARREERTALWLLLPSFLIIAVVALYPFGRVVTSSFTDERFAGGAEIGDADFIGLQNYRRLLSLTLRQVPVATDPATGEPRVVDGRPVYENPRLFLRRLGTPLPYDAVAVWDVAGSRWVLGATSAPFIRAVWDTLVFTVASVAIETLLGMIIALTLATKFFGRGVMRAAMLVPWAIITVVSARIWEWMLQPTRAGFFNTLLNDLGITDGSFAFLRTAELQIPAMVMIDVWKTTPFMALLLLAGLATIPRELYEAAEVDGASPFRRFFSITLPLLAPTLAVALIFRTLDALRVFDLFQVVFGEARYSMASFAYYQLIAVRNVGMSSAASVVIFVVIFAFALFYIRSLGVDRDEQ